MFPEIEIGGGGVYAFIVTLTNRIKIYSIKPIHGRLFYIPDLGLFQLDEKYRYTFKKSEVYFYSQSICNPLNIEAINEIGAYLDSQNLSGLTIDHLSHYVNKFRTVDEIKKKEYELYNKLKADIGESAEGQAALYEKLANGTIRALASHFITLEAKANPNLLSVSQLEGANFSDDTIQWLNDLYREDVIARNNLLGRTMQEERFKLRSSMPAFGIVPQRTMSKRNIALIILNNRVIELDPFVKVELDPVSALWIVKTKKHGDFRVEETKTRYRYGKTNIYVVAVKTTPKTAEERPATDDLVIEN